MYRTVLITAIVASLVGPASAALDTSNAYTDGDAVTWSGSSAFSNGNLSATVEYVVNDRVLHDGDLQFEYVYQLTSTGSTVIATFSVGMQEGNEAEDIGYFQIDTSDVSPTGAAFAGVPIDTANWTFGDGQGSGLSNGDVSYALNYWSVNEPLSFGGSIQNGEVAGGEVPSPSDEIPEPALMSMLCLGATLLLTKHKRKK